MAPPHQRVERMFETSFVSEKRYEDPFNDVDVDVVFSDGVDEWRMPAFWHGGDRWTVRFAPARPGNYRFRVECTASDDAGLHGREGAVEIAPYSGSSDLLRRGFPRVAANRRNFEFADGTPFFWLGDTWWTGLSDRLSWEGFQELTADRVRKGYTVVQIVGGLVPAQEEHPPLDPGNCNEGGSVWEPDFARLNPRYFDCADRRIEHLIEAGITPAIVGAWMQFPDLMGVTKLKQHWRYLIARYGSYPVFWIAGGEIYEYRHADDGWAVVDGRPHRVGSFERGQAWAEIARYIRDIDPFGHPLTVHELPPPFHGGLVDQQLTDFSLIQPAHFGWSSLATSVAQLTTHYAREPVKPVVQGELGYEHIGGEHHEDFQRMGFWLSMLNGAAGHTYGAVAVWEAYTADRPFHRTRWSLATWQEAMHLPGGRQVGLNAGLLRGYPWERFEPRPEWVTPRGTTLFEPNRDPHDIPQDLWGAHWRALETSSYALENEAPSGAWRDRQGTFRRPYASGIPGEVRFVYIPYFGLFTPGPPTLHDLEAGARYRAFYWEPIHGIKIDLGAVARPGPGELLVVGGDHARFEACPEDGSVRLVRDVQEEDLVLRARIAAARDACLLIRYLDSANHISVHYGAGESILEIRERADGVERVLSRNGVDVTGSSVDLHAEVRGEFVAASIGERAASPIVKLRDRLSAGRVGSKGDAPLREFELRASPRIAPDEPPLERKLYDVEGRFRGELSGPPEWEQFGRNKVLLLAAYQPPKLPFPGDWVLVLERS